MSEYKVVNVSSLDNDLKRVADSIRAKSGTSDKLIFPDGYIATVDNINKAKPEQEKTVDITENGTTEVTPDEGKVLSKVTVNVDVASSGGGNLPVGYSVVDFIEFNGSQMIDTGFVGNQDTEVNVCFTRENSLQRYLLGCASSDNTAALTIYLGGSWRFGSKSASKSVSTIHEKLTYTAIINKTNLTLSGAITSISGVSNFETIGTILLGGCRSSNGNLPTTLFSGKVFNFIMWQGGEQILKLVPVVSSEGVYRFFDMVSKTFFDSTTSTPLDGGNL